MSLGIANARKKEETASFAIYLENVRLHKWASQTADLSQNKLTN